MSSKALDEEGHCDDKANAHEEDAIPIGLRKNIVRSVSKSASLPIQKRGPFLKYFFQASSHRDPLSNGKEGVLVEQKVLQSHQRTLCVDLAVILRELKLQF